MHPGKTSGDAPRDGPRLHTALFPRASPQVSTRDWIRIRDRHPVYRQIEGLCHQMAEQMPIRSQPESTKVIDALLRSKTMAALLAALEEIPDVRYRPKMLTCPEALSFALKLSSRLIWARR